MWTSLKSLPDMNPAVKRDIKIPSLMLQMSLKGCKEGSMSYKQGMYTIHNECLLYLFYEWEYILYNKCLLHL